VIAEFFYHPDIVLTDADLEIFSEGLLAEIPIPGVEAAAFDSGIIRRTLLQAAADQSLNGLRRDDRYSRGLFVPRLARSIENGRSRP